MSSLVSFVPAGPADWEMILLNAANVLLGLVVAGFLLLLVGALNHGLDFGDRRTVGVVELAGRRSDARRHARSAGSRGRCGRGRGRRRCTRGR